MSKSPPDQPRQIVDGRFLLEVEHKRGGMGVVWRARDLHTDGLVAVKLLLDGSSNQAERFLREGALLADLRHPGIVAYLAQGTTERGTGYLAMEWLDGETLAERLERQPLGLGQSLTLLRSALRGLSAAHRRGVVHRDLKPSNLFLRGGRLDDVVLLDLGLARSMGDSRQLTRDGAVLGTPSYMAPEQAQGQPGAEPTPAVDVFALGAVLFECLTGAPPYMGSHLFAVLAKLLFEPLPRLRAVRPDLPSAVEDLLDQMLEKDPRRRLADADALAAALAALDPALDAPGPGATTLTLESPSDSEQELVSVILASFAAGDPLAAGPEGPLLPEVSAHGGELKRLHDGTVVITLGQRGGAATDLATRAARCALALAARLPGSSYVLATGRGIAQGRVHIGEAVDRAALMLRERGATPPAAIWLDGVTAGLLDSRFRTARLSEGIVVFALEGEDPSVDPERLLRGKPTTCLGRDHELGMLELALRACVEDSAPRAVLVVGAPGIGKSRLRHELVRRLGLGAGGAGGTLMLGSGDPIRTAGARGLLGSALCRLCGIPGPSLAPDLARGRLEARLGLRLGHLPARDRRRTIAFLGELCGLPSPADDGLPELRGAQQNPAAMPDLVRQAWLTFLAAEAAAGPVVLILDDLQWSDAGTISLVEAALRGLGGTPLLVLALGRPETTELFPGLWSPQLTTIPLAPLGPGAQRRLVRQALGSELSDESVELMVRQAGGNALYLEEIIRAADARHQQVPETVLAMLQARIGGLPTAMRRVLRAASVFGEDFSLGGVTALSRGGGQATPGEVEATLTALARHEIVERQADDGGPAARQDTPRDPGSGDRWRFRHALMRDAAYALLTAEDRQSWHALAAQFLEASDEDPAVVAGHAERGGQLGRAVALYTAAAERAYQRNDFPAVRTLASQALACGASGEARGIVRTMEASARFYGGELEASWAAVSEAVQLVPPGHPRRVQALGAYKFIAVQLGKTGEGEPELDELLSATPGEADRGSYARALGFLSTAHVTVGRREPALRVLARLEQVDREAGPHEHFAHAQACFWLIRYQALLGDQPYAALAVARRGLEHFEGSGDRRMLGLMLCETGELLRRLSSVSEGIALGRRGVALTRAVGEPVAASFALHYLAAALAEHGADHEQPEAQELAEEAIERAGTMRLYRTLAAMARAQVATRTGDLDVAEAEARQAQSGMAALGMRSYYPQTAVGLGRVLLARGQAAAAAQLAEQTMREVHALGTIGYMEIPVRLWSARARLAVGRTEEAARDLREALAARDRRARQIPDAEARRRYLEEIPDHGALVALAAALGLPADGTPPTAPAAG